MPEIELRTLGEVPQHLIAGLKHRFWSRSEPVALHELNGEAFVMRQPGSQTRAWTDVLFAQHHIQPRIVAEFDNPAAIKRLVEQSAALAIFPQYVIDSELKEGHLRIVPLQQPLSRTLRVVWHNLEPISLQAEAFIQHVTIQAAKGLFGASAPAGEAGKP